jgi:hypothetical protein
MINQLHKKMEEKLEAVKSARNRLLTVPLKFRDEKYSKLCAQLHEYIKENCIHTIIRDLIDIDPDTSKTIYYCSKCLLTF